MHELERVCNLAALGGALRYFRGADRHLREGRGREHQFRSRDFVLHGRDCRHPRAILALTKQYQPLASILTRTYAFLALSGIATGAFWLCNFRALKLGGASPVAPANKPTIAPAVFGAAFLGARLTAANWCGIVLVECGAVLLIANLKIGGSPACGEANLARTR